MFTAGRRTVACRVNLRSRRERRLAFEPLENRLAPTTLPPNFTEALIANGLSAPTAMEFALDPIALDD